MQTVLTANTLGGLVWKGICDGCDVRHVELFSGVLTAPAIKVSNERIAQ